MSFEPNFQSCEVLPHRFREAALRVSLDGVSGDVPNFTPIGGKDSNSQKEGGRISKKHDTNYRIKLYGSFDILDRVGERLSISSKKSTALIALLCRSEGMRHDRSWLTAMLWGSRGPEQAQSSLRQELLKLRKTLNTRDELLHVSRTHVWLDTDLVKVDRPEMGHQFLEGIDIPGEEAFEDWLREQRSISPSGIGEVAHVNPVTYSSSSEISIDVTLALSIQADHSPDTRIKMLQTSIARGLSEFGGVKVTLGGLGVSDLSLQITPAKLGNRLALFTTLTRTSDQHVLFAVEHFIKSNPAHALELAGEVAVLAGEIVDQALSSITRHASSLCEDGHLAIRYAREGIDAFFSRRPGAAVVADQTFAKAIALSNSSVFWAWRAYNATLFLEDGGKDHELDVTELTKSYVEKALQLDQYNGLTWALLTHVNAFVFRDFEKASICLDKALHMRRDNLMTQDAAALFSLYVDDITTARAAAFRTERMARHLPNRYCFATTQCMVEALSGNFSASVRHGERALSLMPAGDTLLYPPTLRYLAIGLAHAGEIERSQSLFERLQTAEGTLRSSDIDARNYPMPAKRAAKMLRHSLLLVGK